MLAKNSMHTSICVVLLLWATMFCSRETVLAQSDYALRSPDQRIEVKIRASDRLTYDVLLKGAAILQNSTSKPAAVKCRSLVKACRRPRRRITTNDK